MTWLLISGAFLALLGVVVFMARRSGRTAVEKEVLEKNADIKEKQLEAALDKPSKSELIERLKKGRF